MTTIGRLVDVGAGESARIAEHAGAPVAPARRGSNARSRRFRHQLKIAAPRTVDTQNARSDKERPTLTIPEAAWALNVSVETAYRRAKIGDLPGAFRFGRRWVVSREAFNRFLANPTCDFRP